MKKKIFGGIAVLAFAAIVGLNVKMNASDNQVNNLALANVEALADSEGGGSTSCGSSCRGAHCGTYQLNNGQRGNLYYC